MTSRRRWSPAALALPLLLLVACAAPRATPAASPEADATPAQSAAPTPTPVLPSATLPDGTAVTLELAITPEEHSQGLMYRPEVPETRGMLFLFDQPTIPRFWMKNTWAALDIVFLDAAGSVIDVVADAPPCHEEPCPEYSPRQVAGAVLELKAGTAARHGVTTGARLVFQLVPGYPTTAPEASPS
jgi:uncharacterized membrane protein (UPF0127 family)